MIVVVDYDPAWPDLFHQLKNRLWAVVRDVADTIEHVGSTSVPGLAAKPVIDLDIVVEDASRLEEVIDRLASIGYQHLGDLGVADREAFREPASSIRHNLYACPHDGLGLRNHLAVREYLRVHADVAAKYGKLKLELAQKFAHDIDGYIDGKTEFLLEILRASSLSDEDLEEIERANRK